MNIEYKNHGKKWSVEDVSKLTKMYTSGKTIFSISSELARTPFAIECKLKSLGVEVGPKIEAAELNTNYYNHAVDAVRYLGITSKSDSTKGTKEMSDQIKQEKCIYKERVVVLGHDVKEAAEATLVYLLNELKGYEDSLENVENGPYKDKILTEIEKARYAVMEQLNSLA